MFMTHTIRPIISVISQASLSAAAFTMNIKEEGRVRG